MSRSLSRGGREQARSTLQARIGHDFSDLALLELALTHASVGSRDPAAPTNERLEFLGDRVLGLLVAERLSAEHPRASEGELTIMLHQLVNSGACAEAARRIGLPPSLHMTVQPQGRDSDTILGDAMEAVIAAAYLDGGLEAARRVVDAAWAGAEAVRPEPEAKTALQTWALGRGVGLPSYVVTSRQGSDHAPRFTVRVTVGDLPAAEGEGGSRKAAEKAAAAALLEREGVNGRT